MRIALLAGGVIGAAVVAELLLAPRSPVVSPQVSSQPTAQEMSANMAALPQIELLEEQLKNNPGNDQLRLQLANLLQDNRFFDKAIVQYAAYLNRNPDDADARVDLGICYNDVGNFQEAERQMKAAVARNPKHVLGHLNLGIINLQAGNVGEANTWFRKTIDLAPNSSAGQRARQLLTQHATVTNPQPN